ncbi:MAG: helix-turn-helix transcriptional regulator [Anaerolineae bacterium]|nr:helix-turn-helix transcriptional regulator [Anaerolineae bacterium]
MASPKSVAEAAAIRRKILGVKVRHARTRAGLGVTEVAQVLEVPATAITEIELGQRHVTLPQLEAMALMFNVPVTYFWSNGVLKEPDVTFPTREAMALRQRIIGALLRQARTEADRTTNDLANHLGVSATTIDDYELGREPIPLQNLEAVTEYFNIPITYFVDEGIKPSTNGYHEPTLNEIADFSQLPQEVREFLSNPANLLYVNIAMKLSELSADTLRALAEGLLEVTY